MLTGGLIKLDRKFQYELNAILRTGEIMWFQRPRTNWLKDGDRNTMYDHMKDVNRRRRNKVIMLKNDERVWIEEVKTLQDMLTKFYRKLFTKGNHTVTVAETDITYPNLPEEDVNILVAPISDIEVQRAVLAMQPWKAPRPDGFPTGFYQKSWTTVGESVCEFLKHS